MPTSRAIFDANAFIATVVELPYSGPARRVAEGYEHVAPDLCAFEIASGLGKAVRSSRITAEAATDGLAQMAILFDFAPALTLLSAAHEMGLRLAHSPHDCVYLVLAEREGVPFVTNDQQFLAKIEDVASVPLLNLSDLPEMLP